MPFVSTRPCLLAGILVCLTPFCSVAEAEGFVAFDFPSQVACREIETANHAPQAGRKTVELVLRISIQCPLDRDSDLSGAQVQIRDPSRTMEVVDFSPATLLTSEIVGEIEHAVTTERESSATAGLAGELVVPVAPATIKVKPLTNLGGSRRETVTESVRRQPPKQRVVTSGTVANNHGVFFQFAPTPQSPLEGTREISCVWDVPAAWRGGELQIECRGWRKSDYLFVERTTPAGQRRGSLAVYLAGDSRARQTAAAFARAQWQRREAAARRDPLSRTLQEVAEETQEGWSSVEESLTMRAAREYTAADRDWQQSRRSLQALSSGS